MNHKLINYLFLFLALIVAVISPLREGAAPLTLAQTASTVSSALTPLQREIETQRQRLGSPEPEERRDALMRLGNLKRPDSSRAAAAGLKDTVLIVRATAVHAVLYLPGEEAVALLILLLRDRSEFVRRETAFALGETRQPAAVESLVGVLANDNRNSVRGAAAVALGQIGDESAVSALAQILNLPGKVTTDNKRKKGENEFVLRAAARSLGQIRSPAGVPSLIAALSDESKPADVRREAAIALGSIGDSRAVAALEGVLTARDPYLSRAAFEALREVKAAQGR